MGTLERRVGSVLRLGVLASSVCLSLGLLLALRGDAAGMPNALLTAGLVALLATPVSRVLVSVVVYLRSRDWVFAALTVIVLLELALSVFAAFRAAGSSAHAVTHILQTRHSSETCGQYGGCLRSRPVPLGERVTFPAGAALQQSASEAEAQSPCSLVSGRTPLEI